MLSAASTITTMENLAASGVLTEEAAKKIATAGCINKRKLIGPPKRLMRFSQPRTNVSTSMANFPPATDWQLGKLEIVVAEIFRQIHDRKSDDEFWSTATATADLKSNMLHV